MGTVVVSLDAELGWGFHHRDELPAERIRRGRTAWRRLCTLFDRFDVPATWAVVGHLFLEECETEHTGHPAGPRCCATPPAEAWFAPDLLDRVASAGVDHDIGSHGYTHVHFRHDRMTRRLADRELRRGRRAVARHAGDPTSFVFPVNRVGHLDLLADHGFDCYRGPQPARRGAARKLSDALLDRGTPPIVTPEVDARGLVNVPASQYLFDFEGSARTAVERLRDDPVARRTRRGLDRLAGAEEGVLHLWLHPHNLTRERDFERMRAVLAHVERLRDRGDLRVETMREVAQRVRADRETEPEREPAAGR